MTSRKLATAALAVLFTVAFAGTASAQIGLDPGLSARQVSPESETLTSETLISRSGFQFFGHRFFWGRSVWMPGSSLAMPSLFVLPGDRRWGLQ